MRWLVLAFVAGCAIPQAEFTVECADAACESVRLTAVPVDGADYRWTLDGRDGGTDPEVEHTVPPNELHIAKLEVSTSFGSSTRSKSLNPNVAMELDAADVLVETATGYDIWEEDLDRIIATECSDKVFIISSIGGCFSPGVDTALYVSPSAAMPPALGAYDHPAATYNGTTHVVDKGSWLWARAKIGVDEYTSGSVTPASIDDPGFQAAITAIDPSRWVSMGTANSKHKYVNSVSCEDGKVVYGKSSIPQPELEEWLRQ